MFTATDIFFVLIILIFSLMALAKGLVNELFGKASVIAGIAAAVFFYNKLAPYVQNYVKQEIISKILSFLLIFILVYLVMKIIQHIVAKAFSTEIMHGLDKALGLLLGMAEGLAVVFFLIFLINNTRWPVFNNILKDSFFVKHLSLFTVPGDSIGEILPNV